MRIRRSFIFDVILYNIPFYGVFHNTHHYSNILRKKETNLFKEINAKIVLIRVTHTQEKANRMSNGPFLNII